MTRDDLNQIKRMENLLVSSNTSYLSIQSNLVRDMNSNPIVSIPTTDALQISTFTNDTTRPQIVGFDLDMNRGILSVYFLETINIFSVNYSCFTLSSELNGAVSFTLTGGSLLRPVSRGEFSFSGEGASTSGSAMFSGSGNRTDGTSNVFLPELGSGDLFDEFVVLTDSEAMQDTTALFINFTLNDLNTIKALRIAENTLTSWLSVEPCAIVDQINLQVVPLTSGINAQNVRFYTPDTTPPVLQEFDLDMNTGILVMRFSETVSGPLLKVQQITLQGRRDSNQDPNLMHTLGLDTYIPGTDSTPGLSPQIAVQIKILDLNEVKRLTQVATSSQDTFISVTSEMIPDTKNNMNVPVSSRNGLQVTNYTADVTSPQLERFDLDLNANILTLTFDETVSGSTLNETEIILQEFQGIMAGDQYYQLIGSLHDTIESTVIRVFLSFEDRNEIKRLRNLATRRRNTWIVFSENLIYDTSGNQVVPIFNGTEIFNRVGVFTPDITRPELLNYTLNLTSEILSLSFSETVDVTTLNLSQIVLQNDSADLLRHHRLTGGNILTGDSAFVDIRLSTSDLNDIKRFRDLVTNGNNTFLSFSSAFIQDMNSNSIVEISSANALEVAQFFEDTVPPELSAFDLDLTAEVLYLFFSETVDPSTLTIGDITLQRNISVDVRSPFMQEASGSITSAFLQGISGDVNSTLLQGMSGDVSSASGASGGSSLFVEDTSRDASSNTEAYSLTGGNISRPFDPLVTIQLTDFDLNNIKRLFRLATSMEDTYVSFPPSLITDMNNNSVVSVSPLNAQQVRSYMADLIPPILTGFSLNLDTEVLLLNFSETVNVDSFNLSNVFIQGFTFEHIPAARLTTGDVSEMNDTVIEVRLTRFDLNNLKRHTQVAISRETTNIAFPVPILEDMAGNFITTIPRTSALQAYSFTPDSIPPVLESFDMDLNQGMFTLYFNETVNISSLVLTDITFQSAENQLNITDILFETLTLSGGFLIQLTDEPTLNIIFTINDLNTIKRRAVCQSPLDCYIFLPSSTVRDMNSNPVVPISELQAMLVANYTFDTMPPRLVRFRELNLDNGTLIFEFDETVNVDSFNFTGITLQSFFRNPQATLTLRGGYTASDNGTVVTVQLLTEDWILLRQEDRVCSNINNCWVTMAMETIEDMNGNQLTPVLDREAIDALRFFDDMTPPNLTAYSLDMDNGVLVLTFNEPVRTSTLNPSGIFIQPSPNATEYVQLTEATTHSPIGLEVVVLLSDADIARIRATEFAKSVNDTYLRMERIAISDTAVRYPNPVVAIPNSEAMQVSVYIADTTKPYLVDFSVDLSAESITLRFSEPIRPSSLDVTQITIASAPASDTLAVIEMFVLSAGTVTMETAFDGTFVITIIVTRQANMILKLSMFLARGAETSFVSLSGATLTDMAGNYEVAIPLYNATQASSLTPDQTKATLESFHLDMNLGQLHLSFTDIIVPSSFRPMSVTIQDGPTAQTSISLTSVSTSTSSEGYVTVVQIGREDLNALKYDTSLATSINNTYVTVAADVVRDLQSSDIVPITNDNGIQATSHIPDTTSPRLENFTLDLDSGELLLNFSETVNVGSVDVSGLVLQNVPAANLTDVTHLRLTGVPSYPIGSQSFGDNGSSIVVRLGSHDLNELKRLVDLGTMLSNTFISIESDTIVDMVNLGNIETLPQDAINAITVFPDLTKPQLLNYTLNLTEGRFYLTFSETVNTSTLDVNGIVLQNSPSYRPRVYLTSSSGSGTRSADGVEVVLQIGRDDLNNIKRDRSIATSRNDTFLFLENYVIEDMSGNLNVPIYNPFALQAADYFADFKAPFLLSFDLDLNLGWLILTFDETVETSSLQVGEITLQNVESTVGDEGMSVGVSGSGSGSGLLSVELGSSSGASGSGLLSVEQVRIALERRPLNPGRLPLFSLTFSDDDPIVVISLGEFDLNEIKRLTRLATNVSNTFISFTSATVQDMNGNNVTAISPESAVMVTNLTLDVNPPSLRRYDLDMNTGQISLTFNETVNAGSANPAAIVIQNGPSPSNYHRLTAGSVLSNDSTEIVIQIDIRDLNTIKAITNLATSNEDTYLRFLQAGVLDMFGNPIQAVAVQDATQVTNYTSDMTSPVLVAFDLNMNSTELTLTFDETVNTNSLNVQGIILQQYNDSLGEFHILTPPSGTNDSNSTIFTIQLSREDANEIKRLTSLAVDASSTFVAIRNFTITDMNGNYVVDIPITDALEVTTYTFDEISPTLEAFHLDLDSNQLILSFDETVYSNSLQFSYITLHSGPTISESNHSVTLTGGTVLSDNSHIVYVLTQTADINLVKLYPDFGTEMSNTFLTIRSSAIMDLNQRPNNLIGVTLQTRTVVPDETRPKLRMFTVDLNAGQLALYFDEPVNASTFLARGLTVQSAQRSRTGVRLTNSFTNYGNGLTIVVQLSDEDLNEVKRIDALLVSRETSYVTVTSDFIQDMSGNPIVPIINGQALPASGYVEDMGRPYVTSYQLDMDAGYVVISFSETVNVSTFLCTELTFASSVDCNNSYTLTGCVVDTRNVSRDSEDVGTSGSGSGDYGSAPKWITPYHYDTSVSFWITLHDLNQLKGLEIAATPFTTFLSYTDNTILDQNNLTLLERNCTTMGLPINSDQYTPDTTPLEIVSFNLSIDTGKLVISFTETVRPSTLQVEHLTLQNAVSIDNSTQVHTLGMDRSTRTFDDPTDVLTIYLAPGDLNRIKFLTELAVSNDTTHLSATSEAIMDMKGIELVPVSSFRALPVTTFVPDTTSPVLVAYVLDLNLGLVHLTFDETVNIETLNFTRLTFQAVPDLSIFNILMDQNVTADQNATNTTNTTVLGSGTLLEILDLSVYDVCRILFFQLTDGYVLTTENDPQVTFNITWDDLNDIKREPCLATSHENSYLSFTEGAILDMNDNGIAAVDRNSGINVSRFFPDVTNPNLVAFDLNLTSEILTLFFDETVNASSFDPTQITFISNPISLVSLNISLNVSSDNTTDTNMTQFEIVEYLTSELNHTLIGGDLLLGDDPVLYLMLSKDDLNIIKAITELATGIDNTFIAFTATLVSDMNENRVNNITLVNAFQVNEFTDDRVSPTLVAFDLDLDSERLTLTFDETVNVSSLNFSALTLLSNNSTSPTEQWSLNGGTPPLYSFSPSDNQPVITIDIGYLDINEIKRLSQLAVSNDTTFLAVERGAILDMNANPVVAIAFEDALPVQEYSFDVTAPELVNFDLDLNLGVLVMEFTETINASSVIVSDLLLQNGGSLLSYLPVYNSSVRAYNDVFVFVNFGIDFLNELKRIDDLATNHSNTYLSLTSSALADMSGNQVVAISNTTARMVQNYTHDTTSPQLQSFDLDMNMGVLTLYFDETVRVSTINTTFITLAQRPFTMEPANISGFGSTLAISGSGSGSASGILDLGIEFYTLTGGGVQFENFHIVNINLTLFDLNEIKKLRNLATTAANTHLLLTAEALDDMYTNPVVPIEDGSGLRVSTFTEDITPPDVVFYHLNMNTGILTISFTETVDLRTLNIPGRVVFYNSSDFGGKLYALIDSRSDSTDGPDVVIQLSPLDLNQLKFIRNLASNQENTFLFLNDTISDMVGNIITPMYMGLNQTRPANQFTPDVLAPILLQFNLDLDSGQIFLRFSEVVDQIYEPAFTLQSDRNETNTTSSYTLTGSDSITGPSLLPLGPGYPPELTILLSDFDLNEIKRLDRLAVSGRSTYLSITNQAAYDAFNNSIAEIAEENAQQVTLWTPDTTNPLLVSYDFSVDTGLLQLTFDETVRVSSFNVTTVTFVNPYTATEYTLQDQPPFGGAGGFWVCA